MKPYYIDMRNTPDHDDGIAYLVRRLLEKGRRDLEVCSPVYQGDWLVSDADVLHSEQRNGKLYLTRYEVKSGNGRRKARQQAKKWLSLYEGVDNIVPNFIYYNCADQVFQRMR